MYVCVCANGYQAINIDLYISDIATIQDQNLIETIKLNLKTSSTGIRLSHIYVHLHLPDLIPTHTHTYME